MAELTSNRRIFDTQHLQTDLKRQSVRGGVVTMGAQGMKFAMGMASTMIMARILTPQDYGLVAMVGAVTGFVLMFREMGLATATVQRSEINHSQVSTLFWINVALSLLISLVIAALAPGVAWFYGDPRLTLVTIVIGLGTIPGGFTVQHEALLRRQMRFGSIAAIDIVSQLSGILAGIWFAWKGFEYWSLVYMGLVSGLAQLIAVWVASGWIPGLPVRGSGIRSMLAFGGNLTGFNLFNYLARNADDILIGKFIGADALGVYSKAYALLTLPLRQITAPIAAVATPALSRLQDDPVRYRKYYLKAISLLSLATMPFVAFLLVMSRDIIIVVLGPRWVEASTIFMILAVVALGQPIASSTGWLFVSQNRTQEMLRWGIFASSITVFAFVIGLPWGTVGVATSYTTINLLATPLLYHFVSRKGPISTLDICKAVINPVCITLTVIVALALLRAYLPDETPALNLLTAFVMTAVVAALTLVVLPGGRQLYADMSAVLRAVSIRKAKDVPAHV